MVTLKGLHEATQYLTQYRIPAKPDLLYVYNIISCIYIIHIKERNTHVKNWTWHREKWTTDIEKRIAESE